jgi:hypothetical protein
MKSQRTVDTENTTLQIPRALTTPDLGRMCESGESDVVEDMRGGLFIGSG